MLRSQVAQVPIQLSIENYAAVWSQSLMKFQFSLVLRIMLRSQVSQVPVQFSIENYAAVSGEVSQVSIQISIEIDR